MLQSNLRKPQIAADLAIGFRLAKSHHREITPLEVGQVLSQGNAKYVLVGGHAINGYSGKPRTTVDVDVIVQHPKKASLLIAAAFPELSMQDTPVVIRFKKGDEEAIDLMKPTGSKLWPALLKDARSVPVASVQLLIPSLEGMLAAKFSAMVSIARRMLDRQQDAVDFGRMVVANDEIDSEKLRGLGDLVYPDGGIELLDQVAAARAGKPLRL